jgi:hypothetical protein
LFYSKFLHRLSALRKAGDSGLRSRRKHGWNVPCRGAHRLLGPALSQPKVVDSFFFGCPPFELVSRPEACIRVRRERDFVKMRRTIVDEPPRLQCVMIGEGTVLITELPAVLR